MTISLNLNGRETNIEVSTNDTLLETLRSVNLQSVKCGCMKGQCGACTVLFNGKAVPSCLVPSPLAHNATVETLEGFVESEDYKDIMTGFESAGIKLCGFCNAGKIFAAYELMHKKNKSDKADIMQVINSFQCPCTEPNQLANGISFAIANSHRRSSYKSHTEKRRYL